PFGRNESAMKILIWGRSHELLAGDLPPALKPEEVATLDELRTRADERGALILADPQRVEAELGATAAWIGAGAHVLLVGVVQDAEAEETLKRLPCLHALI